MQRSIALLGDFCQIYRKDMKELINIEKIRQIFNSIREFRLNKNTKDILKHAEDVINKYILSLIIILFRK